jgi:predicted flap endonuclease-1-like 5' DNA nuclease
MPGARSGIFAIDKDAAAQVDDSNADPRARALQIDRLRLNVRLRDDRIRELERALQAQSRREQELERRAADESARADALQSRYGETQTAHESNALERDLDDLRRELAQARERVAERDAALEQERERAAELDRALSHERERAAERERQLEQAIAAERERAEALESQLNDVRGRDTADDLKRIPGIGPAFERALARLGVSSFAQIAQWNADDVLRIAGELNVSPRRIDRDGWIARARELCGMTQIGMPAPALDGGDSDGG